jgi:hypothetical protein
MLLSALHLGGLDLTFSRKHNVITEKAFMRLELTRIGNSRGIRILKPLIAQCGLGDVVDVRLTEEGLVIVPLGMAGSRLRCVTCGEAEDAARFSIAKCV